MTISISTQYLQKMNLSAVRINNIAVLKNAKTYLEIGVQKGNTFFNVNVQNKFAVDPNFLFNINRYKDDSNLHFFPMISDDFFSLMFSKKNNFLKFDIIFIDGLHTYEQTLCDFKNSLSFAHDETIWIIDDSIPTNPYSALPDRNWTQLFYAKTGYKRELWHGDVFKVIFALHDHFPEFSYCTLLDKSQTVVWKTKQQNSREKIFPTLEDISKISYYDIFAHAPKFNPIPEHLLLSVLGKNIKIEYTEDICAEFIYKTPQEDFEK